MQRRRSLVVPREHGAWGILLVPLVTGACCGLFGGGSAAGLAPLVIVALALFWLRTPVESWLGTAAIRARTPEEFHLVRKAVLLLSIAATAGLVWLFWGGRNLELIPIGAVAGAAFLLQAAVRRVWRWLIPRRLRRRAGPGSGLRSPGPGQRPARVPHVRW